MRTLFDFPMSTQTSEFCPPSFFFRLCYYFYQISRITHRLSGEPTRLPFFSPRRAGPQTATSCNLLHSAFSVSFLFASLEGIPWRERFQNLGERAPIAISRGGGACGRVLEAEVYYYGGAHCDQSARVGGTERLFCFSGKKQPGYDRA